MINTVVRRTFWLRAIAVAAIAFGILTIKAGGTVLFGDDAARVAAGNYVPFVVGFNFVAGFAYVFAGAGLWRRQRWALWLAIAIAASTAAAFAAFGVHVFSGGQYEQKTVVAMTVRTAVWVAFSLIAYRLLAGRTAVK
jgi:hypothetical protein